MSEMAMASEQVKIDFWSHLTQFCAFLYYAVAPLFWRYHGVTELPISVDSALYLSLWCGFLLCSVPVFIVAYYLISRNGWLGLSIGALLLQLSVLLAGAGMRFSALGGAF